MVLWAAVPALAVGLVAVVTGSSAGAAPADGPVFTIDPTKAVKLGTFTAKPLSGKAIKAMDAGEPAPSCTVWAYPPSIVNNHLYSKGEATCTTRVEDIQLGVIQLFNVTGQDVPDTDTQATSELYQTATIGPVEAINPTACGQHPTSSDTVLYRTDAALWVYFGPDWNPVEAEALSDYQRLTCALVSP
jgi:hypothetical protein